MPEQNEDSAIPSERFVLIIADRWMTPVAVGVSQMTEWLRKELSAVSYFSVILSNGAFLGSASETVAAVVEPLERLIKEAESLDLENSGNHSAAMLFAVEISKHFLSKGGIYTESPEGRLIASYTKVHQNRFAMVVAGVIAEVNPNGFPKQDVELAKFELKQCRDAHIVDAGAIPTARLLQVLSNFISSRENDYLTLESKFKNWEKGQKNGITEAVASAEKASETLAAEFQNKYDHLHNKVVQHMAMHEPTSYWLEKQKRHQRYTWLAGVATLGVGTFLVLFLASEMTTISDTISKNLIADKPAELWRFASLILQGSIGFWLIKILVRLFLVQVHLATDASERVVMIRTYLSFLNKENLKDQDLPVIINAIFRPAGEGIVKEEGMPFALVDFLKSK